MGNEIQPYFINCSIFRITVGHTPSYATRALSLTPPNAELAYSLRDEKRIKAMILHRSVPLILTLMKMSDTELWDDETFKPIKQGWTFGYVQQKLAALDAELQKAKR